MKKNCLKTNINLCDKQQIDCIYIVLSLSITQSALTYNTSL